MFSVGPNHSRARCAIFFPATLILLVSAFAVSAQRTDSDPPAPFAITISTAKYDLVTGQSNVVALAIRNQTKAKLSLSARSDFHLIDRDAIGQTRRDVDFYAPLNLLKAYEAGSGRCQNDLSPERVRSTHKGQIVTIFPEKAIVPFAPGERRTYQFDLTKLCWNYSISSIYPDLDLFALLAEYPQIKGKNLTLFLEGYVSGSAKLDDGRTVDGNTNTFSNEISMAVR